MFCSHNKIESDIDTILKLIKAYPILVKQPNKYGVYPLHIASYFLASQNVLMKLVESFPDAVALKDVSDQKIRDSINYYCQEDNIDNGKESEGNEIDDDTQRRHDVVTHNDDDGVSPTPAVDIIYVINVDGTRVEHGRFNNKRSTAICMIGGDNDDESNKSYDTDDSASIIVNDDDDDSYDDRYRYRYDDDDDSGMQRAVNERNEKVNSLVQSIVSSPLDTIQQQDTKGNNLLHIACRYCTGRYDTGRDYEEVILKLIELYPIAARQANNNGCFPLHIACCFTASENVLIKLIEVYPEAVTSKYYVLIESILDGFLIHDNDDNEGNFPSDIAFSFYKPKSSWDRYENQNKSTMNKSMMNKYNDSSVGIGLYPLHMVLRNYDPSKNVVMKMIKICPHVVAVPCWKYDGTQDDYPLHLVCSKMTKRSKTVIRTLLELYPDALHETNNDDQYPIHCAFDASQDNKVIKLLLEADPLSVIQQQDGYGNTPLHIASSQRQYKLRTKYIPSLKYMVQHSDNIMINISNNQRETPLHQACTYGFAEIVTALLEHPDIKVNAIDRNNGTPLHTICSICPITEKWYKIELYEVVNILLNHPFIIIDHKNNDGMTPFDVLKEEMKQLEDRGAFRYRLDDVDIHDGIQLLPACKKTIELLEEFAFKQRCDAYSFHLSHFVDLSTNDA